MAEELHKYLRRLLNKVSGLHAIVIADRDGVPVIKVATDHAPDLALRPGFLATFGMATDQGSCPVQQTSTRSECHCRQ
ncbi:ragulator complex protein LAMTOR3-B-like [Saccoglossus kowalevskii]